MSEIIIDIGSGNTLTSSSVGIKLIDEVIKRDTGKHKIVFKFQFFNFAPPNKPISFNVFAILFKYILEKGYDVTSSVFDTDSLKYLIGEAEYNHYTLPFIKIACQPKLYWLIGEIPRKIPVYVSVYDTLCPWPVSRMFCVPKYPATLKEYENIEKIGFQSDGFISDHTVGLDLWHKYRPLHWECHVVLKRDKNNPDAGPWAKLPSDLEGVL